MATKRSVKRCLAVFGFGLVIVQLLIFVLMYHYSLSKSYSHLFSRSYYSSDFVSRYPNRIGNLMTATLKGKQGTEIKVQSEVQTSWVQYLMGKLHTKVHVFKESFSNFIARIEDGIPRLEITQVRISDRFSVRTNNLPTQTTGNWKEGTMCHLLLVSTFQQPIPVCVNPTSIHTISQNSIECFGNILSNQMGMCILENVAIQPIKFKKAMRDADHVDFIESDQSITLLEGCETECRQVMIKYLQYHVREGDYVFQLISKLREEKPQSTMVCEQWIEDDVFFFTANKKHIYFRFLDYFNVHKLLQEFKDILSPQVRLIRISGSGGYRFPEFDQALFPEFKVQTLKSLGKARTCFRKIILVPNSYASVPYQCKMDHNMQRECIKCDGTGMNHTQFIFFQNRVLKACSLINPRNQTNSSNSSIVLVSRQPYQRFKYDKSESFQRILDNEEELLHGLKNEFTSSIVQTVHLEDLRLCDQVRIVHNADIFLGVHGAGLVHLWWLKDDSLVYEMKPPYVVGNPTFEVLASLTGRKYNSSFISGTLGHPAHVRVSKIVEDLDKYSSLIKRNSSAVYKNNGKKICRETTIHAMKQCLSNKHT